LAPQLAVMPRVITRSLSTTGEAVRLACKAIDKTAERGIIHKNQASRRKSRLMKQANKAAAAAA